jgi:hypothetical protein
MSSGRRKRCVPDWFLFFGTVFVLRVLCSPEVIGEIPPKYFIL